MITNSRNTNLDVLKGIGVFFVLFGHVIHIGPLREYIWGFHMPLFFFVSGLLFNPTKYSNFRKFLLSKLKSIYIPYILFFCITFLYWLVIERKVRGGEYSVAHQFVGLFYGTLEGYHLNFNAPLWFLACLFSVEIIFYFVAKMKDKIGIVAMLLLFFILGTLLYRNDLCVLPLGIHTAFFALPFFGIGYLGKSIPEKIINTSFFYRLFLMIVCLSIQLLCLGVYPGSIQAATLPYFPLALIGITLYFTLSVQISSNKIIEYLGINSIVFLGFQEPIYRAIIFLTSKVLAVEIEVVRTNLLYSLIVSVVSIVLIMPIVYFWNKYIRPMINKIQLTS